MYLNPETMSTLKLIPNAEKVLVELRRIFPGFHENKKGMLVVTTKAIYPIEIATLTDTCKKHGLEWGVKGKKVKVFPMTTDEYQPAL